MAKNQIKCRTSKRNQKVHKLFAVTGLVFLLLIRVSALSEAATLSERLISTDESTRISARKELNKLDPEARKGLVSPLIEALKDESKYVRNYAADALKDFGPEDKEAVPALIEALKDKNKYVRYHVTETLGEIGPEAKEAVPALIEALKDWNGFDRSFAARALGKIGPVAAEAIPALIIAGSTPEWVADEALRRIGPVTKEAVPALIKALKDKDESVRSRAVTALGKIGPEAKEAVPALIKALKDKDEDVRCSAVTALGKIGPAAVEAIPALIIAGSTPKWVADEALKKIGPVTKEAVPALVEALKDKDKYARSRAIAALGEIGPEAKEAVPALIEALKDKNKGVRSRAARALGKIGPEAKEAVPALIEALKDKDKSVRYCAITALGEIGPAAAEAISALSIMEGWAVEQALRKIGPATKEAVPALIEALKDKDKMVRYRAALALGEMGPEAKKAVPALIEALKDEDEDVRCYAAEALGEIGPEAKEAVPALIEALKDWNGFDRSFALTALGKIGPTEETVPINEKLGDIFYDNQNWDDALNFYTEAMRLDPQNLPLKEKTNKCRRIAKLEKERVAKGLVVYKDKLSKTIKVRYRTSGFSLLSKLSKEKLIDRGRMAVVTILAGNRQGSGFLISNDGYLLTNEHVVGRARFVKVKFFMGRQVSGEVIRVNKFKDVALIKLERGTYPYLPIGDSSRINVGKDVYAIGTPLSEKLSHTVTKGIVSSFRVINGNRYIQSDVSVHPGNSGGPLISIGNGVVGICVSGIGFGPITLGLNLFIPIEEAIGSLEIVKN